MSNINSFPESPQPANQSPYMGLKTRSASTYYYIGAVCAFVSLIVIPEIFGSVAIVMGAYCWRLECGQNRNRGIYVIVLSLIAMFVGLYYTSYFSLYNILP